MFVSRICTPRRVWSRGAWGLIQGEFARTPHLYPLPLSKGRGDFCVRSSQNSRLFETEITGTGIRWCANDEVIEQFDLQEFGGFGQASRQTVVSLARRRIPGRMIVHNDNCVGRVSEGRSENLSRMRDALIHASHRDVFDAHQTVTRVEQDDA